MISGAWSWATKPCRILGPICRKPGNRDPPRLVEELAFAINGTRGDCRAALWRIVPEARWISVKHWRAPGRAWRSAVPPPQRGGERSDGGAVRARPCQGHDSAVAGQAERLVASVRLRVASWRQGPRQRFVVAESSCLEDAYRSRCAADGWRRVSKRRVLFASHPPPANQRVITGPSQLRTRADGMSALVAGLLSKTRFFINNLQAHPEHLMAAWLMSRCPRTSTPRASRPSRRSVSSTMTAITRSANVSGETSTRPLEISRPPPHRR